ncbi:MAG: hypothetical protein ACJAQT_002711 [Akkermansiaceae bacterium]|jgi:hypothetical protein
MFHRFGAVRYSGQRPVDMNVRGNISSFNIMKSIQELLVSEPESGRHSQLEDLFIDKLNALLRDETTVEIDDYYAHPGITEVERNFMIITEAERGFAMSGNVLQYAQDLEPHAYRWSEVGMRETDFIICACAKISRLLDLTEGNTPESMQNAMFEGLLDLKRMIENRCNLDGDAEKNLVDYVRVNSTEFGPAR